MNLFKVKFVEPVSRDSREQFAQSIRQRLSRANIPTELEISLSDRGQSGLASEIIILANQLKMAANFYNLNPENFQSEFDYVQSDHEDNCHKFDLVENIINLTFTKRDQALVQSSEFDERIQVLVLSEFTSGQAVVVSDDGATLKANFNGIVARRLKLRDFDSTGHSVKVCPEIELIPIEQVSFLN